MDKWNVPIPQPRIFLSVWHPLVNLLKTWQCKPTNIAVLTKSSKSFVVLCKYQTGYFRGLNSDLLHFLESVGIVNYNVGSLHHKEILTSSRIFQKIHWPQLNLVCLFEVIIEDVMNQNFINKGNGQLVAGGMDCHSWEWFSLSSDCGILYHIVFSGKFAHTSQIVPQSHCWVVSGCCHQYGSLHSHIHTCNSSRVKTTADEIRLDLTFRVFIKTHWLNINQANVIVFEADRKSLLIPGDSTSEDLLTFSDGGLPLADKIVGLLSRGRVIFLWADPHSHVALDRADEETLTKSSNSYDMSWVFSLECAFNFLFEFKLLVVQVHLSILTEDKE